MNKLIFDSPIGKIAIFAENDEIVRLDLNNSEHSDEIITEKILYKAKNQLCEYFLGKRTKFDFEYKISGTEFQRSVWNELLKIPFGKTKSYGEIALAIGNPRASRAVGNACNKNKLPIIIPCHRVIGADKKSKGFAYGTETKERLLGHEARLKGEYDEN